MTPSTLALEIRGFIIMAGATNQGQSCGNLPDSPWHWPLGLTHCGKLSPLNPGAAHGPGPRRGPRLPKLVTVRSSELAQ
eukprot:60147-Hanusia_phi.AAC.1